ncbi:MAG: adenylate/guanylate cyclase domain-containing protein [Candidatus Dormiibacterota bacterium]
MNLCSTCGHENQESAKFCSDCGAPLAAAAVSAREERKVVTVLFADLVGFTSRSERMDPEDVRALLSPYYARLRTELERFGGTVEKFIGDAVMALFGLAGFDRWIRGDSVLPTYALGRWGRALAGADEFLAEVEAGSPHYHASLCYLTRAHIRLGRDDIPQALGDVERALELARLAKDPQNLDATLAAAAHLFYEVGMVKRASGLADETLAKLQARRGLGGGPALHKLAWTLSALGRGRELIDVLPKRDSRWVQAAAAFAAGNLRDAADICGAMGAITDEAHDRLRLAEVLVEQSRRAEADTQLQRALAFYRSVGATRYIRQAEALLAVSA